MEDKKNESLVPIEKEMLGVFEEEIKSLEERIKGIDISKEQEDDITKKEIIKTVRDKVLGLFKIGDIIKEIVDFNEKIDGKIKSLKLNKLLELFFLKTEKSENAISKLIRIISNPKGNVLFNKILQIQDNYPADSELTDYLTNTLLKIINSDFESLFEKHKFALAQIDNMTPQAIGVLIKLKDPIEFQLDSYGADGEHIESEWIQFFIIPFCEFIKVNDKEIKNRIEYTLRKLNGDNLIECVLKNKTKNARITASGIEPVYCKLTRQGYEILEYVTY